MLPRMGTLPYSWGLPHVGRAWVLQRVQLHTGGNAHATSILEQHYHYQEEAPVGL